MKIAIGCDHAGFRLKERLKKHLAGRGHDINDFGSQSDEPTDYPDVAKSVALAVAKRKAEKGVLICGTGIGMSIAANKVPGVYAALCCDESNAKISRTHNNSNVLALGARTMKPGKAARIVNIWLNTEFEGGRHARRLGKIRRMEMELKGR